MFFAFSIGATNLFMASTTSDTTKIIAPRKPTQREVELKFAAVAVHARFAAKNAIEQITPPYTAIGRLRSDFTDGKMIDIPIVERAKKTIARFEKHAARARVRQAKG